MAREMRSQGNLYLQNWRDKQEYVENHNLPGQKPTSSVPVSGEKNLNSD
jgi:hypothetical protein